MKTVYLHGKLGKRFGEKWNLAVRTPAEAFHALESNNSGFLEYLIDTEKKGVEYYIFTKDPKKINSKEDLVEHSINKEKIDLIQDKKEIHICPRVQGSGPLMPLFFVLDAAGKITGLKLLGKIVAAVAISFVVGAIMKSLFKPPKRGEPTTTKSFLLRGSENRTNQGVAVPLGYGRLKIGSTNIAQNKKTYRSVKENANTLESYSDIEYMELLSEGPIEGFVNINGGPISGGDIREGIFLNNVQIKNTDSDGSGEGSLNFILNENGELPEIQLGKEEESRVLSAETTMTLEYGTKFYGAGPYVNNPEKKESRADFNDAIKNNAKILTHFVANENVSRVTLNLGVALQIQNDDGSNGPTSISFAVNILKDDEEHNILSSSSGCKIKTRSQGAEVDIPAYNSDSPGTGLMKNGETSFIVRGIATDEYEFDIVVDYIVPRIKSKGVTFKLVKLSNELDSTARGGTLGGIAKTKVLNFISVTESVIEDLLYPHSAICKIKFDSKNFSQIPERSYHVKMKKILIPSNYDPVTRKYDGPWNGLFKGQADALASVHSISDEDKYWSDNPAWIYYDLLHNARYGVGKFGLNEENIDKWQLYKIAKYCDQLVETDYPFETSSGLPRNFETLNSGEESFQIKIDSSGHYLDSALNVTRTEQIPDFKKEFGDKQSFAGKKMAFFISTNTLGGIRAKKDSAFREGEILIEERVILSSDAENQTITVSGPSFKNLSATNSSNITVGACAVQLNHPLVEPRFTANLYLTDRNEALQIINNFASIFRGISTYSGGKIVAVQDSYKNPVQLFTNSNVGIEGFNYNGVSKNQKVTTSLVRYNNKDNNFKPDVIVEEDAEAIQRFGYKEEETMGFGITSQSQARRLAKWILFTTQLEIETVSFQAGAEASYLFPGAIFEVSDEARAGKLKSGRVLDIQDKQYYTRTITDGSGNLQSDGVIEVDNPYILLDKSLTKEPFVSSVELAVCVGMSNETEENVSLRAPFEKSDKDQDAEIESVFTPQIIRFNCRIDYSDYEGKKGPQGQKSRAVDLQLKIPIEVDLGQNLFVSFNHNFDNGDRVAFNSNGILPGGLNPSKYDERAYYIINVTKHTFQVSETSSGSAVEVYNNGFDILGNEGGLHYVLPQDEQRTKEALDQISIGSTWSAKGIVALSSGSGLTATEQDVFGVTLDYGDGSGWKHSYWLGNIVPKGPWTYVINFGWIYFSEDYLNNLTNNIWFYGRDDADLGWIYTAEGIKDQFWYFSKIHENSSTANGWVSPLYDSFNILVELFIWDTDTSKSVGEKYSINNAKYVIVQVASGVGYYVALQEEVTTRQGKVSTSSTPPNQSTVNPYQRLESHPDSKNINISSYSVVSANDAKQNVQSVRITLDSSSNVEIPDGQFVYINGASGTGASAINNSYTYSGNKWTSTPPKWRLIKISKSVFELINSSSAASTSGFSVTGGNILFIQKAVDGSSSILEGQLFRTMSVKEMDENKYEVTGLEYVQAKFDSVDKKSIVRRPVIPIPPQADMAIPEAPTDLILTDLTA